jgi:hypothetical protein
MKEETAIIAWNPPAQRNEIKHENAMSISTLPMRNRPIDGHVEVVGMFFRERLPGRPPTTQGSSFIQRPKSYSPCICHRCATLKPPRRRKHYAPMAAQSNSLGRSTYLRKNPCKDNLRSLSWAYRSKHLKDHIISMISQKPDGLMMIVVFSVWSVAGS